MGLLIRVVVHAANIGDREGAKRLLSSAEGLLQRIHKIWADGGYTGPFVDWVKAEYGWMVEITLRQDTEPGFVVIPKRWVVERTFGWFGRYRRLSKDYEYYTGVSEAFIYAAMIHLMLRRLAP